MNFYSILALPTPSPSTPPPSSDTLKEAYRRALLRHHPDKSNSSPLKPASAQNTPNQSSPKPTIDEITLAFRTLSSPSLRAEHDRELRLRKAVDGADGAEVFHTGLDTVDLDDLEYDDDAELWYRACRCGQERGFVVDEAQLEKAAERGEGEVLVGCRGCSLWLNVLFGVVEETAGQDGQQAQENGIGHGKDVENG
ncbi:hypothetical protein NA57DRAFT_56162 [Rhizodiscina lignyota]|uniref:Diphthamide biosynthesis protein 4 n=1 Tax=Rhizodiscina lignyota TaxID=1504668 RepID=A0A9P4IAW3_9PEZI|nr:hypothetical protein NA57DRAFT_56162 [Rhizodiscina lignyota]